MFANQLFPDSKKTNLLMSLGEDGSESMLYTGSVLDYFPHATKEPPPNQRKRRIWLGTKLKQLSPRKDPILQFNCSSRVNSSLQQPDFSSLKMVTKKDTETNGKNNENNSSKSPLDSCSKSHKGAEGCSQPSNQNDNISFTKSTIESAKNTNIRDCKSSIGSCNKSDNGAGACSQSSPQNGMRNEHSSKDARKIVHNKTRQHSGMYGLYDDTTEATNATQMMNRPVACYLANGKIAIEDLQHVIVEARSNSFKIVQTLLANFERIVKLEKSQDEENTLEELSPDTISLLVFLLQTCVKVFDIQVALNNSLKELLVKKETEEDEDSKQGWTKPKKEDKDDLLAECRSLMNQTPFSKSFVCTHLYNPYSSELRYSCVEDRLFCNATDKLFCIHLPHGVGTLNSVSGKFIYHGLWKKGKKWGHGKAFILSGSELSSSPKKFGMYEGSWWNNMRHGNGRMVFASGAEYNGTWQYDMMSGLGTMTNSDGSSLEGNWDEDQPDGCGIFTWPNGDKEWREYTAGQADRVVSLTNKVQGASPCNNSLRDYAVLRIKYQTLIEEKNTLIQINSKVIDQAENQRNAFKALEATLIRRQTEQLNQMQNNYYMQTLQGENQHQEKLKEIQQSHEAKVKELEEKIDNVKKELQANQAIVECQICFDKPRDCILMPCTHLLYCRDCISKEKQQGRNRCPACRGPIGGEINCNITL